MSDAYTKLFRSITASTIVGQPLATRWLWVTMLSQADAAGCVWGSVPGIARLANITLEECESALECFLSPDLYSRTQDHQGRRIEAVDGGWRLLSHAKYARMRDAQERRDYQRAWDRGHRPSGHQRARAAVRQRSDSGPTKPTSPTTPTPTPTPEDQEQDASPQAQPAAGSASRGTRLPANWRLPSDWRTWAEAERPDLDIPKVAAQFADHWRAKPGKDGRKLDWQATWRNWVRAERASRGSTAPVPAASRYDTPAATRAAMDAAKPKTVASPERTKAALHEIGGLLPSAAHRGSPPCP